MWSILTAAFALGLLASYEPTGSSRAIPSESARTSTVLAQLGMPVVVAPPAPKISGRSSRSLAGSRLSPFDELIHEESSRFGLDWRLVAALIQKESRFDPRAVSPMGAVGLMQIMPQFTSLNADSLLDPRTNLREGLRLLGSTYDGLAYVDSLDRLRFTLAAYNAGTGRLNDARRIAIEIGGDPNVWRGSVASAMTKLSDPRWSRHAHHGPFDGSQTLQFVEDVVARYEQYKRRVPPGGPTVPYRGPVVATAPDPDERP